MSDDGPIDLDKRRLEREAKRREIALIRKDVNTDPQFVTFLMNRLDVYRTLIVKLGSGLFDLNELAREAHALIDKETNPR